MNMIFYKQKMRHITRSLLSIILLAQLSAFGLAPERKGSIVLTIKACKSDQGSVFVALYDNEKAYLREDKAIVKTIAKIRNGQAVIRINDLPFGNYALACFHDENSNNKLDKSLIGIPKEGYGFSNNARGSFGPPRYAKSRFLLNKNPYTTEIQLNYFVR